MVGRAPRVQIRLVGAVPVGECEDGVSVDRGYFGTFGEPVLIGAL
jgi:hypothetical protein